MCVAFMLAELAWQHGLLEQPVNIDELASKQVMLLPRSGASTLAEIDAAHGPAPSLAAAPDSELLLLVRWILLQQCAKGGEAKNLTGSPHCKGSYQETPASWFHWHTVLSVPWREKGDNINLAEARGRNLALRLRARQPGLHSQRFLHLLDSQVNLHVAAKGRSGSFKLMHVQRRSAATLLATGMREVDGFTRSDRNRADAASRDAKGWHRYRRQMASSLAAPAQAQRSRSSPARPVR
jgi:hypothetical protein